MVFSTFSVPSKPAEVERNFFMSVVPTLVSFIAMMLMRNSMGGNKMFVVYCGLTMGIGVVTSI